MRDFKVGIEAQKELMKALNEIAEAVGSTMGPGGRSFGYDKWGTDMRLSSSFSKDGLTVLRALDFPDAPAYQAVLQYCRQASSHSFITSGDGTTSTIVLANAVAKAVTNEKSKYPQYLARILEADARAAVEEIQKEAVKTPETVRKVALTSCNGDEELADIVIKSIGMSSAFGSILVEKNAASSERYSINQQDGYSNCSGYNYNSTFALSASESAASSKTIEWENPYVALFNGALLSATQVDPIVMAWTEACKKTASSLVIVAYDVGDEVTNKLLVLNRKLSINGVGIFVVKPRLTAEVLAGLQVMRDIAAFTGVSDDMIIDGGNYTEVTPDYLGTCSKTKISQNNTAFLGRAENHWVDKRILQNQSIVEEARSDFDREITKIRNAELAEGLVLVQIGGGMLPEIQERADRFDDASKAAQSCMRAGALPGAGASYIRAAVRAGVHKALEVAFRTIYETVLFNFGSDSNPDFLPGPGNTVKVDSETMTIKEGNALEMDVLDACETVCAVIQNGVSLGVTIATLGGYSYRTKENDPILQ